MSAIAGFDESGPIYGRSIVLADSAARTVTGNGPTRPSGDESTVRLALSVTAVSGGTPSMTVNVQTSGDGSAWSTVDSFAAVTGVTTQRLVVSPLDRYVRAQWTITGTTPSFTFKVSGQLV